MAREPRKKPKGSAPDSVKKGQKRVNRFKAAMERQQHEDKLAGETPEPMAAFWRNQPDAHPR